MIKALTILIKNQQEYEPKAPDDCRIQYIEKYGKTLFSCLDDNQDTTTHIQKIIAIIDGYLEKSLYEEYITDYGKALFNYFCRHPKTTKMCITNYTLLPELLKDALLFDNYGRWRIIPVLKLFPYLTEIIFSELQMEQMISDSDDYTKIIFEYIDNVKTLDKFYLKSISFKSQQQNIGEHISQFVKIQTTGIQQLVIHQWVVKYDMDKDNVHTLTFINDDKESEKQIGQLQFYQQQEEQRQIKAKQEQERRRQIERQMQLEQEQERRRHIEWQMQTEQPQSKIQLLDEAFAGYYKQRNVLYLNEFRGWADDNEFDSEFIEQEFNVDPSESKLLQIAETLSGLGEFNVDSNEMWRILKICWSGYNASRLNRIREVPPIKVTAQDWQITDKERKDTIKIYASQCKTIFDQEMQNDACIIELLCVGQKLHVPYLQFLADLYSQDLLKSDSPLQVCEWALRNKHLYELRKIKSSYGVDAFTCTVSAIESFFHRINPHLILNPQRRIKDSLQDTVQYIDVVVHFIRRQLMSTNPYNGSSGQCAPFQLDMSIIYEYNDIVQKPSMLSSDDDDYVSDESDSYLNVFGNIKERLVKEDLPHIVTTLDHGISKMFQYFEELKIELRKKYKLTFDQNMLRKRRFCLIIDRRQPDSNNGTVESDEVIFFEPPDNCNSIPEYGKIDHVPLWYLDSSKTCIIPNIGYENGKNSKHIDEKSEQFFMPESRDKLKALREPITSQTTCNGTLMTFSFHVESMDEIRCYMYWNGQIARFLPEDAINVLSRVFDVEYQDL
eukprot:421698_1